MPTTRSQDAPKGGVKASEGGDRSVSTKPRAKKPASRKKAAPPSTKQEQEREPVKVGEKRKGTAEGEEKKDKDSSRKKKAKTEDEEDVVHKEQEHLKSEEEGGEQNIQDRSMYEAGTIERGHIYFFYRPKVELEEAHSVDDVQRFYMLLVPRPPQFAAGSAGIATEGDNDEEQQEMTLIQEGEDVVPAEEPTGKTKKRFRLIVVGKKGMPDPEAKGRGRVFWGTVSTVGEDLKKLEEGLGESTYETKTRGTRHQGPARLAARGAYAIVNAEASMPSKRVTHLGYYLSHPSGNALGDVQEALGIHQASSFVLQVKNPLAPPTGPAQVGLPKSRRADYPELIMRGVFGMGGRRGRESYGLRFASCERQELLEYEGAELLFIAAHSGEAGLEQSLGEGRGHALEEAEKRESKEKVDQILKELAMEDEKIPADPLEGEWA